MAAVKLINYWPMSGMCDLVGGATLYGGQSYSLVADRFNNPNSAIYFNNGYLQAPPGIYFAGDFTITAWIYLKSHYSCQTILEFGNGFNSNTINFLMDVYGIGKLRGFLTNQAAQYFFDTPVVTSNLNQWYYVAYTLSRKTGSIYVNGALSMSSTLSSINNVTRSTNYIGKDSYCSSKIDAIYDELKIYQGAMSADAILTDYTTSSSGKVILVK